MRGSGIQPLDYYDMAKKKSEAQAVLDVLLDAHPELKGELTSLDITALNNRAGKHALGYTGPSEAAWELLQEPSDQIVAEMERQLELGEKRAAFETCKGLILGLYVVRNYDGDGCLAWAPDFAQQTAEDLLGKWYARSGRKQPIPRSFVEGRIPAWSHIVDRVNSR